MVGDNLARMYIEQGRAQQVLELSQAVLQAERRSGRVAHALLSRQHRGAPRGALVAMPRALREIDAAIAECRQLKLEGTAGPAMTRRAARPRRPAIQQAWPRHASSQETGDARRQSGARSDVMTNLGALRGAREGPGASVSWSATTARSSCGSRADQARGAVRRGKIVAPALDGGRQCCSSSAWARRVVLFVVAAARCHARCPSNWHSAMRSPAWATAAPSSNWRRPWWPTPPCCAPAADRHRPLQAHQRQLRHPFGDAVLCASL